MEKEKSKVIVKLENATKIYKDGNAGEIRALNDLTMEIQEGEMIAITGPSGSGKSTLLYVLSGIERLTEGRYTLEGKDVTKLGDSGFARLRNAEIGIIMQDYGLLSDESVLVNVCLPEIVGNRYNRSVKKKAGEIMEELGLGGLEKKVVSQLSGGQKQRVAIARCLMMDTKLILADEPTGSLDSANTEEIVQIFRKLNEEKGKTVVIVTHDPLVAAQCPKRWNMVDGRISTVHSKIHI